MSKIIDMTGKRYGKLTVLYRDGSDSRGTAKWRCKCDCGNECVVLGKNLRNGNTQSCGCLQRERTGEAAKHNALDITGQKFHLLTALEPTKRRSGNCIIWKCQCDCGNFTEVALSDLKQGKTKSCGCMRYNSYGEQKIKEILDFYKISYKKQLSFPDLKNKNGTGNLRYDFGIYNKKGQLVRLIEFDGEQHYTAKKNPLWSTSLQTIQENDKIKNAYAKNHNIPLIRIPYKERDKITIFTLLKDDYLVN